MRHQTFIKIILAGALAVSGITSAASDTSTAPAVAPFKAAQIASITTNAVWTNEGSQSAVAETVGFKKFRKSRSFKKHRGFRQHNSFKTKTFIHKPRTKIIVKKKRPFFF